MFQSALLFPLRCVHFSKYDSAHKPVIRFHAVDIGFCNGFHAVQSVWNQPQIRHRTHDPRQRQQPMPTLKEGIARFDLPRRRKKHTAYQFALCSLLRFRIAQLYHCMVTGMAEQIRIQSIAEKLFDRRGGTRACIYLCFLLRPVRFCFSKILHLCRNPHHKIRLSYCRRKAFATTLCPRRQPLSRVSRKQRYNTLDFASKNRVPTGMLRAPIGNPAAKGIAPL